MFGQQQMYHEVINAFKAGAAGYLTKDCPPEELIQALRKVVQGGHYESGCCGVFASDHGTYR